MKHSRTMLLVTLVSLLLNGCASSHSSSEQALEAAHSAFQKVKEDPFQTKRRQLVGKLDFHAIKARSSGSHHAVDQRQLGKQQRHRHCVGRIPARSRRSRRG